MSRKVDGSTNCIVCNNDFGIDENRLKATLTYLKSDAEQLHTIDIVVHKSCGSFIRNLIDRLGIGEDWIIETKFEVVQ